MYLYGEDIKWYDAVDSWTVDEVVGGMSGCDCLTGDCETEVEYYQWIAYRFFKNDELDFNERQDRWIQVCDLAWDKSNLKRFLKTR